MDTAADILSYTEKQGISLSVRGQKLILDGPKGTITPELIKQAKQHKVELILMAAIRRACEGLGVTPEQFDSLLTQEDRDLIIAGKFEDITLRAYAESFAEGIASGRIRLFKGQ